MGRKPYTPKWGRCKDCGEPIWKTAAAMTLCDACRELHRSENVRKAIESRKTPTNELHPKTKTIPKVEEPTFGFEDHVCLVSNKCKYGNPENGHDGCNYMIRTGQMRTLDGKHLIHNGVCDLYTPGKKATNLGWKYYGTKKGEDHE